VETSVKRRFGVGYGIKRADEVKQGGTAGVSSRPWMGWEIFYAHFEVEGGIPVFKEVFGRDEKRMLIMMSTLFILGIATGCFFTAKFPDVTSRFLNKLYQSMYHLAQLSGWRLVIGIFLNNLRVSLILLAVGALLPFIPGLVLFFNGWVIGVVFQSILATKTVGLYTLLKLSFPHGILELPAVIFAAMAGTLLGLRNWRYWLKGTQSVSCKAMLTYAGIWLAIVIVLLVPAAIIEVFITPEFV
jgi:stage II sporulation protein M